MSAAPWEVATHTDIGGREEQQDRVLSLEKGGARLLVLADGMGGHDDGSLAAEAVMEVARRRFGASANGGGEDLAADVVRQAHERIHALGAERRTAPHSTCVVLHLTARRAVWTHVGDSRMYRFRNGGVAGRTLDHSMVELLRLQGRITEAEMKTHPDQNRLFEALGGGTAPALEVDGADPSEFDAFLLASDGLWAQVSDRELARAVRASDLGGAVRGLVERAKARGGADGDNISVAVARRPVAGRIPGRRLRGLWRRAWRWRARHRAVRNGAGSAPEAGDA